MKMRFNRLAALASAAIMAMSIAPSVIAADYGWQDINGTRKYLMENDEYAVGNMDIDGIVYTFSADGTLSGTFTGLGRKNQRLVYYRDGVIVKGQWIETGNAKYYSYPNGVLATGIVTIDGKQYNFSTNGQLRQAGSFFSVSKNKEYILIGRQSKIEFTVSADHISGQATLGAISEMHRYSNGKWYKVEPSKNFAVTEELYYLGNVDGISNYCSDVKLSFVPEAYNSSLTEGHYRVAIPVYNEGKKYVKYSEFDVVAAASVSTPRSEYNIAETSEITFTINVNTASKIYSPEVSELYFHVEETDEWKKVEPKANHLIESNPVTVDRNVGMTTKLDLTRYAHVSLKTGTYRAVIGDGITCEFRLVSPYEATIVQDNIDNARKRQVTVTVYNQTDSDVTLKGYGQLYYYKKGKWIKLKPKNSRFDTEMKIPAMHKWSKSLMLTDYYSLNDLKAGNYSMRLIDTNGFVYQANFTLK